MSSARVTAARWIAASDCSRGPGLTWKPRTMRSISPVLASVCVDMHSSSTSSTCSKRCTQTASSSRPDVMPRTSFFFLRMRAFDMSIESRCASTLNRGKASIDGTAIGGLGVPPCVDAEAGFNGNDGSPAGGSPKLSRSPRVPPTAAPYAGVGEAKTAKGSSSSKSPPEELSRDKERGSGRPDDGTSAPRAVFSFASKTFRRPTGIPISSATDCARFDSSSSNGPNSTGESARAPPGRVR